MERCGFLTDSLVQFPSDKDSLFRQVVIAKNEIRICGNCHKETDQDPIHLFPIKADDESNPGLEAFSVAQFEKTFHTMLEAHEHIIGLFSSDHIVSSFRNALQAVEILNEGERISVIDSRSLSTGLGNLCNLAVNKYNKGFDFRKIEEEVRSSINNSYFLACVPSPSYLYYSGLSDFTQALSSEILSIFPIVSLEDGDLKIIKKVKTIRSASELFIDFLSEFDSILEISLICSNKVYEKETENVEQFCSEYFPSTKIFHLPISMDLACLFGPHSLALSVVEK